MYMFTEQLANACRVINETLGSYNALWTKVLPAVDGIVFYMTDNNRWKYWYETRTITKLEPWRSVVR